MKAMLRRRRLPRTRPDVVAIALALVAGVIAWPAGPARAATGDAWVEQVLASMSTRAKVGQLFVPRVYGTTADTSDPGAVKKNLAEFGVRNAVELVQTYAIGGLIYFGPNITTVRALAEFGNAVQQAAAASAVPVLTAIDQEQGLVVRVGPPATMLPGSMALGATRSTVDADLAARITGSELRAMGVYQDYAPVADVNVNPSNPVIGVRSFGSSPGLVAQLVAAQVVGYQGAGVAATAKHFPGHGDTGVDSHTSLPVITHDRAQLEVIDLAPFRAAIAVGVDAIMTAHIVVPAVDPSGDPATLSAPIISGILRDELGFEGVVVTDSLRMQGVRTKYADGEVAVRAILAGADQLLDPPDLPVAFNAVLDAIASGRIGQDRLDASVRRILSLKAERGLTSPTTALVDPTTIDAVVGNPAHQAVAQAITDRTTTLVMQRPMLPLRRIWKKTILVTGRGATATLALGTSLRMRGASVRVLETGAQPTASQIAAAVGAAGSSDIVIALTADVQPSSQQAALIAALQQTGRRLVVAATSTPYDIAAFPSVPTYLATYASRPIAMESLARVLAGEVTATGRLPVAIPKATGGVLYPFGWRAS